MSAIMKESLADRVTLTLDSATIEVSREAVMQFVTPMWGFESHQEFALVPAARNGIWWFLGTGDSPLHFVLADPFVAMSDCSIDLNAGDREELGIEHEQDALVLVLLTMPSGPGQPVTGNFRAPLVFNVAKQRVKQVVNRDERLQFNEPVDLLKYPLQDGSSLS
jgi:flagellar assembly factor FliW